MVEAESSSRVLVTGGSGFVGSAIVAAAERAGLVVHAPDESELDILDAAGLARAAAGMDAVIHSAGLAHIFDKRRAAGAPFHEINEVGTGNVAQAAARAGAKEFVLISSVSVYGGSASGGADEATPCRPQGSYARSKHGAELRAAEATRGTPTRLSVLRMATIYGRGDPGNVARLIDAVRSGRFVWIGSGSNRKSLIHRDDAAGAAIAALGRARGGPAVYNVSAEPCTMREIVDTIARHLGRRAPRWGIPAAVARAASSAGAALCLGRGPAASVRAAVHKWLADDVYRADRIGQEVGFRPAVSLDDGLADEVAWRNG